MAHQQYLEQTIQHKLQAALEELVSKQPEDPISYLADYFERENKPEREPLLAAADLLRELRSLAQPSLDKTVYQTYALLSDSNEQCLATGVTAPKVNALITTACSELDPSTADALLRKLQVQDGSNVLYPTFKSRVTVCVLLLEYLRTAVQLFHAIDSRGTGSMLRQTGEDLLSRLSAALSVSLDIKQNVEQTKYLLKPLQLNEKSATEDGSGEDSTVAMDRTGTLSLHEFQQLAARVFISHLPSNALIN